jgi:hypothetical protein
VDSQKVFAFCKKLLLWTFHLQASNCDCEHVVKPVLDLTQDQVDKLCPRCQCKHEERSTITIKAALCNRNRNRRNRYFLTSGTGTVGTVTF